jgi:hypothetical protein
MAQAPPLTVTFRGSISAYRKDGQDWWLKAGYLQPRVTYA